jgi:hypothetical protein
MSRNSEQAQAAEADADALLAESMPGLLPPCVLCSPAVAAAAAITTVAVRVGIARPGPKAQPRANGAAARHGPSNGPWPSSAVLPERFESSWRHYPSTEMRGGLGESSSGTDGATEWKYVFQRPISGTRHLRELQCD